MKLSELLNIKSAMKKAREMSMKSDHHQAKVGAVVLQKNKALSSGYNQDKKTHPFLKKHGFHYNQSIHAEMAAIFRMKNKENLKGATIVVYRETKDGHMAMSKPCAVCQKLMRIYGVKKIMYSTENGICEEILKD